MKFLSVIILVLTSTGVVYASSPHLEYLLEEPDTMAIVCSSNTIFGKVEGQYIGFNEDNGDKKFTLTSITQGEKETLVVFTIAFSQKPPLKLELIEKIKSEKDPTIIEVISGPLDKKIVLDVDGFGKVSCVKK